MNWLDDLQIGTVDQIQESGLAYRLDAIEGRIAELEEWLGHVANDMLDRTSQQPLPARNENGLPS